MKNKLYMVLLGCRPEGRLTEQHDIFFGVGEDLNSLIPQMKKFWPGVNLHIDAYRSITRVGEFQISISEPTQEPGESENKLFLINLGGYDPPEFEEYHKKILVVADNISKAIAASKEDQFYEIGQKLGDAERSHIDDKMEVDDVININQLIPEYRIEISRLSDQSDHAEEINIGYIPFSKI